MILAFDLGHRRIGVACGDTISRNAAALKALPATDAGPRWDSLDALMREWRPDLAVVGLPYNADGSESSMTGEARSFAAQLQARFSLEVELVDERYSSMDASARLKSERESGLRKRRVAKADIDAVAASIILERWFTEHN